MKDFNRFLNFRKEITEFELKKINQYLKGVETEQKKRTTQFEVVKGILKIVGRPMHISEIIQIAKRDYQVHLERDSIVSIIIKKIKTDKGIIRTSPNTFALK